MLPAILFCLTVDVWALALARSAAADTPLRARAAVRLALVVSLTLGLGWTLGALGRRTFESLAALLGAGLLIAIGVAVGREGLDRGRDRGLRAFPTSLSIWTRLSLAYGVSAGAMGVAAGLLGVSGHGLVLWGALLSAATVFTGLASGPIIDRRLEGAVLVIGGLVLIASALSLFRFRPSVLPWVGPLT